jgi:hypothetical protein
LYKSKALILHNTSCFFFARNREISVILYMYICPLLSDYEIEILIFQDDPPPPPLPNTFPA